MPSLSISPSSITEDNAGTKPLTLTVNLSTTRGQTVTVTCITAARDSIAVSGVLTFAPGVTSQLITLTVNGDMTFENTETFFVDLMEALYSSRT